VLARQTVPVGNLKVAAIRLYIGAREEFGMRPGDEAEYREFVVARLEAWRRTAYLVCRDWHAADDVVAATIERLYLRWRRLDHVVNLDAYVRGMLIRAWLDEQRRPWRREFHVPNILDQPSGAVASVEGAVLDRLTVATLLESLTPRKRAVLVLRFFCDLSVEETAELLSIAERTVKSQTARALEMLRALAPAQALRLTDGSDQ
jgi:RNA polymerase sigma factor (sigma-70 family)